MRSSQRGNAVIFILLAVGLFGALAYTFTRGSQQGQSNITEHQANIAAQEIMNFYAGFDKAINKLLMRGCSVNELSMSNSNDSGPFVALHNNASAPADKSCHVFAPEGGGLSIGIKWSDYQNPVNTFSCCTEQHNNAYLYINDVNFLGTAANDWLASVNFVRPEICSAVNKLASTETYCAIQSATEGQILHVWQIN
jgi:hypothetical protein